jgi:hypothetical protein
MRGTIQESMTPDLACRGFHLTSTGTLSGVPLGEAVWSASECVDFLANPGGVTVRDGTFSLDDGLLIGTSSARGGLPDATGHVFVMGPFSITGGSGAYTGAQGGGTLTAVVNVIAQTAELELNGDLLLR